MPKLHWYKRDPAAFLDGTMTLTLEETGAYAKVLELIYVRDGACPDNERWIAGHLNCDVRTWRRLRARLLDLGKLYLDGDGLRNARADSTIASGLDRLEQTISAGRQSGEKRRKSKAEPSNFNGSGGTPVPTDGREIKTKKEKKDTPTSSSGVSPPAPAHEAAAAPEGASFSIEGRVLARVEAEGRDARQAAGVLATLKSEFGRATCDSLLADALRVAKSNVLELVTRKAGDERERRRRAEESARLAVNNGWSVEGIVTQAIERETAARDAWTVTACPQIGSDT